jgi:uncharacterized surface protein with fasciclin (FAS1) repeats
MKRLSLLLLFMTISCAGAFGQMHPTTTPSERTLIETLKTAGNFNTLISLIEATGLRDLVTQGNTQVTLLAPNDDAFARLPKGTQEALAKDPEKFRNLLLSHMVQGKLTIADMLVAITDGTSNKTYKEVKSIGGDVVSILCNGHGGDHHPRINQGAARIGRGDLLFAQGVVHEIDAVLLTDTSQRNAAAGADAELKKVVADMKQKTQDLERLGQKFDDAMRALEKENRLGNSQIQELMSEYNSALYLHSRVLKKLDETAREQMRRFD